jgi:hypothetical protein
MTKESETYSPLKIGLLASITIWFLFSFHELFKAFTSINEYSSFSGPAAFWVQITDISGAIGLISRTVAGFIAVIALIYYFRKQATTASAMKILRIILIAEAIYWLALLLSGIWGVLPAGTGGIGNNSPGSTGLHFNLGFLIETGIPCLVESIAIPVVLFKLILELNPNKSFKGAIKWGLIAGVVYLFVFWLGNTSNWIYTIYYTTKGTSYLTSYPENILSFVLTTVGLLALTLFSASFAKKSIGAESIEKLKMKTVGIIITLLGLYFLWNYLTWIFFGSDQLWSQWFAWFLGHNMDLWVLSVPLIGLPLLLRQSTSQKETVKES